MGAVFETLARVYARHFPALVMGAYAHTLYGTSAFAFFAFLICMCAWIISTIWDLDRLERKALAFDRICEVYLPKWDPRKKQEKGKLVYEYAKKKGK